MSDRRPSDPNVAAHDAVSRATGMQSDAGTPDHVTVTGDVATCGKCAATLRLSRSTKARSEDLRAFGVLHRHGG